MTLPTHYLGSSGQLRWMGLPDVHPMLLQRDSYKTPAERSQYFGRTSAEPLHNDVNVDSTS